MEHNLSVEEIVILIKGCEKHISHENAERLSRMGVGMFVGFPNEFFQWNESFFNSRNEEELYSFYKELKSWGYDTKGN